MMGNLNEQIGIRVCQLRRHRGFTQEQLAEMLDCSVQFVSMVERGRRGMSLRILCACASALRVSVDELLGMEMANKEIKKAELILLEGCSGFEKKMISEVVEVIRRNLRNC